MEPSAVGLVGPKSMERNKGGVIIIIIMVFIKRPMLVVPFLKCCTYIETKDIK